MPAREIRVDDREIDVVSHRHLDDIVPDRLARDRGNDDVELLFERLAAL